MKFANAVAFTISLVLTGFGLYYVLASMSHPDAMEFLKLDGVLRAVALLTALLGAGSFFMMASTTILTGIAAYCLRGKPAIGWISPKEATSFYSWVSFEWDHMSSITGKPERHRGHRFFGFEVALSGTVRVA